MFVHAPLITSGAFEGYRMRGMLDEITHSSLQQLPDRRSSLEALVQLQLAVGAYGMLVAVSTAIHSWPVHAKSFAPVTALCIAAPRGSYKKRRAG